MSLEVRLSCPYGHKCEQVRDGYIERCVKYIPLKGLDRNTGKEVDEYNCTEVWQVILSTEGNQFTRETGAAIESFRNEMVRDNDEMRRVLSSNEMRLIADDT